MDFQFALRKQYKIKTKEGSITTSSILVCLCPMLHLYTLRKYQKTLKFPGVFLGVWKCITKKKRVSVPADVKKVIFLIVNLFSLILI